MVELIYITGDTHIPVDISKLNTTNFPEQKKLSKDDFVIVLGDFGLYWQKDKTFQHWYDWLQKKPFTTLWLDGNHENHQWINSMKVSKWNGGKVHKDGSIIHLMRGQVYNIEGHSFFVFGGADSIDKQHRIEGVSWWKEEVPNFAEINEGIDNLASVNYQVDYVLTHTCPINMIKPIFNAESWGENNVEKILQNFFDLIHFKKWYFGHWHEDVEFDKFECLYNNVQKLEQIL